MSEVVRAAVAWLMCDIGYPDKPDREALGRAVCLPGGHGRPRSHPHPGEEPFPAAE